MAGFVLEPVRKSAAQIERADEEIWAIQVQMVAKISHAPGTVMQWHHAPAALALANRMQVPISSISRLLQEDGNTSFSLEASVMCQ